MPRRSVQNDLAISEVRVPITVGMRVVVDMAGFRRYGLTVAEKPSSVHGTVVSAGSDRITVDLDDRLFGRDTVTVGSERVTPAQSMDA